MDPTQVVYETDNSSVQPISNNAEKLEKNVVGLAGALGMSLAFISPTTGVLFISTLIASQAGIASPFAFIIGTLGVLLINTVRRNILHFQQQRYRTSLRLSDGLAFAHLLWAAGSSERRSIWFLYIECNS